MFAAAALGAFGPACQRSSAPSSRAPDAVARGTSATPLAPMVTILADGIARPNEIAFDDTYVYAPTILGPIVRVLQRGGAVSQIAGEWPPPGVRPDRRHAYWDPALRLRRGFAYDDSNQYWIDETGVFRRSLTVRDAEPQRLARSFAPRVGQKVLLVDGNRLVWLEPAAEAVLAVPTQGGAVSFVCEARNAVHVDLAIGRGRIHVLDIGGQLSSVPIAGGTRTIDADLDSALGQNRNGVWLDARPDALYVVSDALGFGGPSVLDLGAPPTRAAPIQRWEGRIVRIEYPSPGRPGVPEHGGLLFVTTLYPDATGALSASDLPRLGTGLAAIASDVRSGRITLTLSFNAGDAATARTNALVDAITNWLHAQYGAAAAVRVQRRALPNGRPDAIASIDVGVGPEQVAALFAP